MSNSLFGVQLASASFCLDFSQTSEVYTRIEGIGRRDLIDDYQKTMKNAYGNDYCGFQVSQDSAR